MRLGVGQKLLAGFTVLVLISGVIGWLAISRMSQLNDGMRTLYEDPMVGAIGMAKIQQVATDIEGQQMEILIDPAHVDVHLEEVQPLRETFAAEIAQAYADDTDGVDD